MYILLLLTASLFLSCSAPAGKPAATPADIHWTHLVIDHNGPQDPHVKSAGDLDGDGRPDLIVASSAGGAIVWYHSPDWTRYTIAEGGRWSCDAEAGDMDGDGDNDLVISDYYLNKRLEWYENPGSGSDPATWTWKLHIIGPPRAHDLELADLDSDGDLDIISRSQSGFGALEGNRVMLWYHGPGDTWTQRRIDCPHGEGFALADMDRDGRVDVVMGGRWFANPGSVDGDWPGHVFAEWNGDAVVRAADINADGRPDVVLTEAESTGDIAWFECPADPSQAAWTEHVIGTELEKGHSLGVADLDGDGDPDVATAEMYQSVDPDYVLVFVNTGGGLGWKRQVLAETGSHGIRLRDFDADGDIDIFGSNWQSVAQDSLTCVDLWRNDR